jgi:hypothetical protein
VNCVTANASQTQHTRASFNIVLAKRSSLELIFERCLMVGQSESSAVDY